ncbi:MAG TPA: ECF transporter S component [Symbiobacteriaceae bacterium]|nr:ECF transporter S component [Symbiobacteriaceae bacterium]
MQTATAPTRRLVAFGLLYALSVIGSYIKVGPMSIALDSAPGFLAALAMGPGPGALICALGHLTVALLTGFPLTPPFHLAVAVTMAGVGALGGFTAARFGRWAGAAVLVAANGVAAPAVLSLLPNPMGRGLFAALLVPLLLGAGVNAVIAAVAAKGLKSGVQL